MKTREPDTEQLLEAVQRGDDSARGRLLARHRRRLRKMVTLRLDRRLAARVDPSDVVQEALAPNGVAGRFRQLSPATE
jgi:RNA polymerase sigma-70 factor (ECF subfamily)